MVFRKKEELVSALRNWNIDRQREIFVEDSRPKYYKAICYTNSPHYNGPNQNRRCPWMVAATMKNKDNVWKITKWFEGHICYGSVQSNNNRCLTSSIIAIDIISYISQDIAYEAWNSRRIAIERLFGTWQSNLAELPTCIDELLHTNLDTIVRWAFGPQGNYIGKMLTTVAKNANMQILPVAFAVVDNESNESWAWFLKLVQTHVNISKRDLCIISDRHVGILNAMANQQYGWHHRYCLRHIRSNLMTKFNRNTELKKLCWRACSKIAK
ncbi:uncharacterized protein [Rutidosis leptorrhynchoides]|uniref:uncharacterized protein n=1 Tax=Rutidosis leptorrhynchoides TaxID=125765 RepID=UPI003A99CBF1